MVRTKPWKQLTWWQRFWISPWVDMFFLVVALDYMWSPGTRVTVRGIFGDCMFVVFAALLVRDGNRRWGRP